MKFDLNLTPEDIEQLVKDSIMRSGFGAAVTTGVQKALGGYNSPIDEELRKYISQVMRELLASNFGAAIKEAVTTHMEKLVTAELIQKVTSEAMDKMIRHVRDY